MILRCSIPSVIGLLLAGSFLASAAANLIDASSKPRHFQDRQLQSELQFSCTADSFECYDLGDNSFQLTEELTYNSRSAIWANQLVNLERSFTMEAQILIDSPTFVGGEAPTFVGGEGLALVFQTEGNHALGSAGNGKGYKGINPCVAIGIDTHRDTGDSRISIVKNTPSNVLPQIGSANIGYIKDLRIRRLRVEYDGASKQIQVHFDGATVLVGTLDLVAELGGSTTATWGFTASSAETLSSDQWVYIMEFDNQWPSEAPSQSPSLTLSSAPSFAHSTSPSSSPTSLYLLEDFNAPTDEWAFQANLFNGTSADVGFVSGEKSSTKFGKWHDGVSTGGLRLRLASGDERVSGGWATTLVLPDNLQSATLDFKFRAGIDDGFLPGESGQVLAEVNGVLMVIETIEVGASYLSFWGDAKVELGALAAGTYQIKIGGHLAASASQDQVFQIRIDNVSFTGVQQG